MPVPNPQEQAEITRYRFLGGLFNVMIGLVLSIRWEASLEIELRSLLTWDRFWKLEVVKSAKVEWFIVSNWIGLPCSVIFSLCLENKLENQPNNQGGYNSAFLFSNTFILR